MISYLSIFSFDYVIHGLTNNTTPPSDIERKQFESAFTKVNDYKVSTVYNLTIDEQLNEAQQSVTDM